MPINILIVEDEPLISEDLSQILKKEGYEIIGQAFKGVTAIDLIDKVQPDLVLLDILLPGNISGLEIGKILSKKQIPFVFITSFSDKNTLETAKVLLPEAYIVKPFKKKDIIATIEMIAHKITSKKPKYLSLEEINAQLIEGITPKEYEIALDFADGLSNQEICNKHFISLNTVKAHTKKLFSKMDLKHRSQMSGRILR